MVGKLTVKQEKFAQKYVETSNASEAYRQSYNAENMNVDSIKIEASRLMDNPNIALTVKTLRDELKERHNVTVDSLTIELEEARQIALTEKQSSSAVSASMGKAKLHGLDKDKLDVVGDFTFTLNKVVHSARDND